MKKQKWMCAYDESDSTHERINTALFAPFTTGTLPLYQAVYRLLLGGVEFCIFIR
jgi:hypothetical protein